MSRISKIIAVSIFFSLTSCLNNSEQLRPLLFALGKSFLISKKNLEAVTDIQKIGNNQYALLGYKINSSFYNSDRIFYVDSQGAPLTQYGNAGVETLEGTNLGQGFIASSLYFSLFKPSNYIEWEDFPSLKVNSFVGNKFSTVFGNSVAQVPETGLVDTFFNGTSLWFSSLNLTPELNVNLSVHQSGIAAPLFSYTIPGSSISWVSGSLISPFQNDLMALYSTSKRKPGSESVFINEVFLAKVPVDGQPIETHKVFESSAGLLTVQRLKSIEGKVVFIAKDGVGSFARRVNVSGEITADLTYGTNGLVDLEGSLSLEGKPYTTYLQDAFINQSGDIYVCGKTYREQKQQTAIWKFLSSGSLDTSFNKNSGVLWLDSSAAGCRRVRENETELMAVTFTDDLQYLITIFTK